jgi:Protein of unknwon function (DUF3310)
VVEIKQRNTGGNMTEAPKPKAATDAATISAEQMRQLLAVVYASSSEAEARDNVERWLCLDEKATQATTAAAPLSVEEMRAMLADATGILEGDRERAMATAAGLERLTNWILEKERDAGRAPIPALETVGEAFAGPADEVELPAHYTQGDIECIDAIKAQLTPIEYRGYLRGQVAKYNWRLGVKGSAHVDALKAHWYLTRLVRELGGGK